MEKNLLKCSCLTCTNEVRKPKMVVAIHRECIVF